MTNNQWRWKTQDEHNLHKNIVLIIHFIIYLFILLPLTKKFYIPLDKANWSQPKMEKSYI